MVKMVGAGGISHLYNYLHQQHTTIFILERKVDGGHVLAVSPRNKATEESMRLLAVFSRVFDLSLG